MIMNVLIFKYINIILSLSQRAERRTTVEVLQLILGNVGHLGLNIMDNKKKVYIVATNLASRASNVIKHHMSKHG